MRGLGWFVLAIGGACGGGGGSDGGQPIADGSAVAVDARPGSGDAAGCTVGQVVWLDDGFPRCSIAAIAVLGVGSTDTLDITATDVNGIAITLLMGGAHPFMTPQTFTCGPPQPTSILELTYSQNGTVLGTAASCAVQVTQLGAVGGANAQGTFSAVLSAPGGGTRTLAGGRFDVPRRQ
jgi:hypothetical protein